MVAPLRACRGVGLTGRRLGPVAHPHCRGVEWTMPDFFSTQELIQRFEPAFTPALFERSLLVVGLGGNGTHLALAAVRMGFARVVGVDCDLVSESNLSRQVLYTRGDVGRRKAEAAGEALARRNL